MYFILYLTPEGWRDSQCALSARLETWSALEKWSSLTLMRWVCVWYSESLDMEQRRCLHQRFGPPPVESPRPRTITDSEVRHDGEPACACTGHRTGILSNLMDGQRQETEWEGLKLVIVERLNHWQVFVYDMENCEVLHTVQQPTAKTAKYAALEFAVAHRYGPGSDLRPEVLAEMLEWEPY